MPTPPKANADKPKTSKSARPEEGSFDFRRIIAGIYKHWPIVAALTLLATGGAFLWSKSQPRIFQASAMLEFDPNPVRPLGSQNDPTAGWTSYFDNQANYQTQFTIITSDTILTKVARDLSLQNDPRFNGRATAPKEALENAVLGLRARIIIEPVKESRLFYVRVEDSDKALATRICHAVSHAYVDHNLQKSIGESSDAALWLTGQVDHYDSELKQSETALHEFKKDNELPSSTLEEVSKMIRLDMATYDEALSKTRIRRKELEARHNELAKITVDNVDILPASELLNNPFLSGLRVQYLAALKEKQEQLAAGKGDNHPLVKAADERITGAKRALVDEVRNIQGAVERDLSVIEKQEAGEASLYEEARKRAVDLNLKELEYHRLDRARDQNEKMYATLLQRMKEADLARMMKVNNVTVIDEPVEPKAPIRPNTLANLGTGALLGLVLGIGLAILREQLDSSMKTPGDVEDRLGITFLGMLPSLDEKKGEPTARKRRRRGDIRRAPGDDPAIYVHQRPLSGVAEAARSVRTNLHFMSPDHPHRIILVTSSAPAEGKTTVACSIAIAMAQSGQRVCIVDCDLRRPRLHRVFGRVGDHGLTSILIGEAAIDDVAKPAKAGPQGGDIPNLWCIPAGSPPPNPADLLHSERFKKFLSDLGERFDRVIIDSPPLAAVTDSAIVSTLVDTTVFVIRANHTSHYLARQGLRALHDVDSPIAGAVLNAVDLSKTTYSYYYQQYYYYRREGYGPVEGDSAPETEANASSPPPN
ncbi:MAG TPA: polysaccharide biosynthesis tyrosine autokinase [Polyangiaceae bacterium]